MAVSTRSNSRKMRKARIRKKISGSSERPRLSIFRSSRYIYAQIVDDQSAATLCACSSLEKDLKAKLKSTRDQSAAKEVGKMLAERAKRKDIKQVVFDRNGFIYHGRIKALAEGAREAGLDF